MMSKERLSFHIEFAFNAQQTLFIIVSIYRGNTKLELGLSNLLGYLFQHEKELHSDDSDFCYCLAKYIKKVQIDAKITFAIAHDYEMALMFENAYKYTVNLIWQQNKAKTTPIQLNLPLPITLKVTQKNASLNISMLDNDDWKNNPLSWLMLSIEDRMICFSSGYLSIHPPDYLLNFLDQFLDTPTLQLDQDAAEKFISDTYPKLKAFVMWQINADFTFFQPETLRPMAVLKIEQNKEGHLTPTLGYKYHEEYIWPDTTDNTLIDRKTGKKISRDTDTETAYQQTLMDQFMQNKCQFHLSSPKDSDIFLNCIVPSLEQQGWEVLSNATEISIAKDPIRLEFQLRSASDKDWFYFDPNCKIDNNNYSLQELAHTLLKHDGYLKTSSGYKKISEQSQQELNHLISSNAFKVNKQFQKRDLLSLISTSHINGTDKKSKHIIDAVHELLETPTSIDLSLFNGTLRTYQKTGVHWLLQLHKLQCAALLADDMGLGKTVQCISYCTQLKGPYLIVGPTNVIYNWQKEIAHFAPAHSSVIYTGNNRDAILNKLKEDMFLIVSYGVLKNDLEHFIKHSFPIMIIDEAQYIKNQKTTISQAIKRIHATFKIALTGTPVENNLGDIWSIIDFLMPDYLPKQSEFERQFKETPERIKAKLKPFILRREKKEVLDSLPEKNEIDLLCELTEGQQKLYETVLLAVKKGISSAKESKGKLHILSALLKLRQVCTDPTLISEFEHLGVESAKLQVAKEKIKDLISNNHKIVLFSQFTGVLNRLQEWGKSHAINLERIDGTITGKNRQDAVNRFQTVSTPTLFLISLKAGGVGINLTAADYVFHLDPWWNPAVESQATDRVHRMGQKNKVFVYKLITKGTIEEKIRVLNKEKQALYSQIIDIDSQAEKTLDMKEIQHLLLQS